MAGLKYSLRALARTPIVSLVVVLSLGLGIGANTAIFSIFHQVLMRSLPVQHPEQLVTLTSPGDFKSGRQSMNNAGGMDRIFSYLIYRQLERDSPKEIRLAAFRTFGANLAFKGKTLSGSVALVSGGYFPQLGVQPLMGRMLGYEDDQGAGQPVAVLSYGYWMDRLGGRSDVLNQQLRANGQTFTIVGVAPKNFTGTTLGDSPDLYAPLAYKPVMTPGWNGTDKYDDYYLYVFGRLQGGATRQQAEAALNGAYAPLVAEQVKTVKGFDDKYKQRFRDSKLKFEDGNLGQSDLRENMKTPLMVLIICTGLVLLIAAANAANLLLARAAQRARELSIRISLGASVWQIVRQLMMEAMLLSVAGGVVGVILGSWVLDLLLSAMANDDTPNYALTAGLDGPVMLFALGVTLLTGFLFGLYPAWAAARGSASATLKEDSANASASRHGVRARKVLVTAQVAISILLLIPMGLFLKSLVNLMSVDLGLKTEHLMTFGLSPELNGYKPEQSRALFIRLEEQLSAVPGFTSVTSAMVPLIAGNNWGNSLDVEGFARGPGADNHSNFNLVGPGFLGKMGIPLVKGREFTESDTAASPKVGIVNETWAKHFFKGQNPIGRKFGPDKEEIEIVGVVKDSNYSSVRQKPPRLYFLPYRQQDDVGTMSFYVRSSLPPAQVAAQIRRVVSAADPDLPIEEMRTMDEQISRNIRSDRLVLQLACAFGVLATLLAMLGLYGVMAFGVTRRTREIGIRMAMGANAGSIRSLVLREVAVILAFGILLGVPAALALSRLAESQLFGVKAYDLGVVVAALFALSLAAVLAGLVPAYRASRVNPVEALRYE